MRYLTPENAHVPVAILTSQNFGRKKLAFTNEQLPTKKSKMKRNKAKQKPRI